MPGNLVRQQDRAALPLRPQGDQHLVGAGPGGLRVDQRRLRRDGAPGEQACQRQAAAERRLHPRDQLHRQERMAAQFEEPGIDR
jgi:hypothetical protein